MIDHWHVRDRGFPAAGPGDGGSGGPARGVLEGGVVGGGVVDVGILDIVAFHLAYTLIAELQKRGMRLPEDCAVTGFDGVVPPPGELQVTLVRMPYRDMGVTAVARLLGRRAVMSSPRRHILLSPEFLVGETTGPVGGARA